MVLSVMWCLLSHECPNLRCVNSVKFSTMSLISSSVTSVSSSVSSRILPYLRGEVSSSGLIRVVQIVSNNSSIGYSKHDDEKSNSIKLLDIFGDDKVMGRKSGSPCERGKGKCWMLERNGSWRNCSGVKDGRPNRNWL